MEAVKEKVQRTKLFVYAEDSDREKHLVEFDNKEQLDVWLADTNMEIIQVIRGFEKKMKKKMVFI